VLVFLLFFDKTGNSNINSNNNSNNNNNKKKKIIINFVVVGWMDGFCPEITTWGN